MKPLLSARRARVVEREHQALVRDDDLGDALIFDVGACIYHAEHSSVPKSRNE